MRWLPTHLTLLLRAPSSSRLISPCICGASHPTTPRSCLQGYYPIAFRVLLRLFEPVTMVEIMKLFADQIEDYKFLKKQQQEEAAKKK